MTRQDDGLLKNFGDRITELRTKKGMSLRQASLKCNLDPGTMSKIENGLVNVTLTTVAKLAEGLDVPLKDIFNFDF
jgi:transcriptional regulator with XRE-family HTH domain